MATEFINTRNISSTIAEAAANGLNSARASLMYRKIWSGRTVYGLSKPSGLKVTNVNAPTISNGADSPSARDVARMLPVAIPGTAAGSTWRYTVCHCVAPRANPPCRSELGTARIGFSRCNHDGR